MPAMAEMILELYMVISEKDISLSIAKKQKLNGNQDKYEVILTRD
jgi:N-acetylmuramoyl-L-alanine amidase